MKNRTDFVIKFERDVHNLRCVMGQNKNQAKRYMSRLLKSNGKFDGKRFPEMFRRAWLASMKNFELTDNGDGARFAAEHFDDIRYCENEGNGTYYVWDGKIWVRASERALLRKARETVRRMKATADAMQDGATGKAELLAHWKKCDKPSHLKTITKAATLEDIAVSTDSFDAHPDLLCCGNGIIDLRTAKLADHDRSKLVTQVIPWDYDPNAKCKVWKEFIDYVARGDKTIKRFLQKLIGYALTGHAREKSLFVLYSKEHDTGKTTFIEVLRMLLGFHFVRQTDFTTFTKKSAHRHIRNDIAMLRKMRVVTATEGEKDDRFDGPIIKALTGGDMVVARFLRQEYFEFKATFKIFLATNVMPKVQVEDEAAWSRFVIITFGRQISPDKKDHDIMNKFRQEISGILNWALEGARMYYEDGGLKIPQKIHATKSQHRGIDNPIASFVTECCEETPRAVSRTGVLYSAWKGWCAKNGFRAGRKPAFGRLLAAQGFGKTVVRVTIKGKDVQRRALVGIKLLGKANKLKKSLKLKKSK